MVGNPGGLCLSGIWALPVEAINVGHVLQAVEPIWHDKPETASRVRGKIEDRRVCRRSTPAR